MPFGLGYGVSLIGVYVTAEPQTTLKLHQNRQISIPRLVRNYRRYLHRFFIAMVLSLLLLH